MNAVQPKGQKDDADLAAQRVYCKPDPQARSQLHLITHLGLQTAIASFRSTYSTFAMPLLMLC